MIPGFTAELACGPTSSYRGVGMRRTPAGGSVLPQLMMSVPFWDPGSGGWGTFTVNLPDDPHGAPGKPVDPAAVHCRARCLRLLGTAARRACLAEC